MTTKRVRLYPNSKCFHVPCAEPGCSTTVQPKNKTGRCAAHRHKDPETRAKTVAYSREHYQANRGRSYDNHLRRTYGITLEQAQGLLDRQGGVCPICVAPLDRLGQGVREAAVDHCHATGRVRGVLCVACNKAIGILRDCPDTLRRAATYLESK